MIYPVKYNVLHYKTAVNLCDGVQQEFRRLFALPIITRHLPIKHTCWPENMKLISRWSVRPQWPNYGRVRLRRVCSSQGWNDRFGDWTRGQPGTVSTTQPGPDASTTVLRSNIITIQWVTCTRNILPFHPIDPS